LKDKLLDFWRKVLAHADRSATAALGIILLTIIGLYMHERSSEVQPPEDLPRVPFEELLPNDNFNKVQEKYIAVSPDIIQDAKLKPLIEFNMFDLKEVKAQEELEKQFDEQVEQAARMIKDGKKAEALKVLESVLARKPRHVRALDLKNELVPPSPTESPSP
jgi:hypothetical protein